MAEANGTSKPDFEKGFPVAEIPAGGMVLGEVDGEDVILSRRGDEIFAVGAFCTHYHGPLADGLVVGETVRCPWHHACFSLRTGEALHAPALDPIACWRVEIVGETAYVREKNPPPNNKPEPGSTKNRDQLESVLIVGGGAAGLAAAEMLRRDGYQGTVTILSADDAPPCNRPNLSKDFLAGTAQEDWIPLRPSEFYTENKIDLVLGAKVTALDVNNKRVQLQNGKTHNFGALLIATGAEPVQLMIAGATDSQLQYLRTLADSKAIIAKAATAKSVVVVGASFIGLEVAASLRNRGIEVHVVAPEKQPLERIMGPELGRFIRELHEAHGVNFHLGEAVARIDGRTVMLTGGRTVDADFVVLGVEVCAP